MQLHLRFGMHRDIPQVHGLIGLLDGLVIPANILSYQDKATSVFVTSLPADKDYVIDPMTHIFQQRGKDLAKEPEDRLRLSVQKLCDDYHPELAKLVLSLGHDRRLTPDAMPDVDALCRGILSFQLSKVRDSSSASGTERYRERYGRTAHRQPRLVLTPYFEFQRVGDDWYSFALRCAARTRELAHAMKATPPVAAVICCPLDVIDDAASVQQIGTDYADFDYAFIWVDGYTQAATRADRIRRVRSLISTLTKNATKVEALYGGYLMMMSHFDNLQSISHGILYTEHKSTEMLPGSGGPPDRYYIPAFHEFRSMAQADIILHLHPELVCDCPICGKEFAGNPDNIIRFAGDSELPRAHFLHSRRREIEQLEHTPCAGIVSQLRTTFERYHGSVSRLPNPDALVTEARMRGLEYLQNWAEAFD